MFCFLKIGNFITKGSDDLKTHENNLNPAKQPNKPNSQKNLCLSVDANENVFFDENHASRMNPNPLKRVHPNSKVQILSNRVVPAQFLIPSQPMAQSIVHTSELFFFLQVTASKYCNISLINFRYIDWNEHAAKSSFE